MSYPPILIESTLVDVYCRQSLQIVKKLRPQATGWYFSGSPDYDGLVWEDKNYTKPSREEFDSEMNIVVEEFNNTEYQRKRMFEYPDLGEFVDAFYWMQKGDNTKMDAYIQKCDEVKSKYPKP